MSTGHVLILGAIAGGTIFLGLPIGRLQNLSGAVRAGLSALATGILIFLLWDVLSGAVEPIESALGDRHWGDFTGYSAVGIAGFALGARRRSSAPARQPSTSSGGAAGSRA